jgi:CRP-like cAMP-binding protein
MQSAEELLRTTPIFSRLSPADRRTIAEVSRVQQFERGQTIFEQEAPSDAFYAIASGRVKIFKMMPSGRDVILEVFGPGDPLGAVAVYMDRPFPASAMALEDTTCVIIPRQAFFRLIESNPSLVRGLLLGMTTRLVELTNRLAEADRRPHRAALRPIVPEARVRDGPRRARRHVHPTRSLEAGAGGHDGNDRRNVHPDHESVEQGRLRAHGTGWVRRGRAR